jgi:hypothetical protein
MTAAGLYMLLFLHAASNMKKKIENEIICLVDGAISIFFKLCFNFLAMNQYRYLFIPVLNNGHTLKLSFIFQVHATVEPLILKFGM